MDDTVTRIRLMILIVLSVCTFGVWFLPNAHSENESPYLQVYYLDVGQGDSTLIETPSGIQVLIDGGPNGNVLQELASIMGFSDTEIDIVVGTHPDKDHIGGLVDVLKKYDVKMILTTENESDSGVAKMYNELKTAEGAEIIYARRGQEFALDASTTLRVLFPDSDPTNMESNTSSIVLQLIYGDTAFMFTGDSPKSIEEYLVLVEGESLQSNVLKTGHHGSRTSTSQLFLDEVQPEIAIISAGLNNSYGHPHVEVTDMLFNAGIQILETAKAGTLTLFSDGKTVWQE
jgi:beta-lactamase superfamily II metal-dependent hydrolase